MNLSKRHRVKPALFIIFIFFALCLLFPLQSGAATMQDYCIIPPFVTQSVPPLVMFEAGRDHKLYYEAYNDASDLDEDGKLDITYKHTIDYYGYYDSYKCYTYNSSGTGQFNPVSVTGDKFCGAGQWSGNVLNWLNMSRMDSLKKVLYGGHRVTDSNTETVLERDIMPGDAHSWGKELTGRLCYNSVSSVYTYACKRDSDCDTGNGETCVDKSLNLIGIAAATEPFDCSATGAITWSGTNNVRVARYHHNSALGDNVECGTDPDTTSPGHPSVAVARANFLSSFQPEVAGTFIDQFLVTNFNDARLDPTNDHYDHYNTVAVAEFNVASGDKNKSWQFIVDGDDADEVEIGVVGSGFSGGTVVASNYGCHSECFPAATFVGTATAPVLCNANQLGTYVPGSSGYHRVIVRHSERTGQDGVKLWYRIGSGNWATFPGTLTTRTPDVAAGAECTLKSDQFVARGDPQRGTSGGQHLFCGTNLAGNQPPILRMVVNNTHRKWEWVSIENPVCLTTFQDGQSMTPTDYTVRAQVCNSAVGLESNCKKYGSSAPYTYKPTGLLQTYGEGDGSKVCSKVLTKSCNSDTDCTTATEGLCVDKSQMYFGFMTTSYTKNTSGGVLRKNFGSITDETNINNGILQTSENVQGNIIITFDRLSPTVGYDFGSHQYTAASGGTCGWITNGPITEGQCRMWGNPIAEMMYESLRYMAGKGAPTAAFDYSGSQDSGLSLSHPSWGYNKGATWYQPYQLYPACARPFMLVLSDVNTSFDNDQLPGAYNSSFTEDAATPQLNINVSTLADIIGVTEGISGHSWFIGESSGTTNDFVCSAKPVTNLSRIDGICPFEPTKKGSYYAAAVSYYAKTQFSANTGKPNAETFVVALDAPLANLKVKAGSNYINVLPLGKSVSGGSSVRTNCADKCTLTYNINTGLTISNCSSNAFCPTNQVVDIYVDAIKYDNSNNVVYANYRINFEDVEQGADHDMDAIVQYEICTADAVTLGYGSCGTALAAGEVQVKVNNVYGKGGIDQVLGFIISGTTADGAYLVVKDGDVSAADGDTPALVAGLPLSWSKTFTTTGSPAGVLQNPLWYAAKWGGFEDMDGDGKPYSGPSCGTSTPDTRCREWDKNGDGIPDNYFLVANPLKLEEQLNAALQAILKRASSGTAASVLASGTGSGANMIQAIFYPKKRFDAATVDISWLGTLQNYWYFVDPNFSNSTILEDTDSGSSYKKLELGKDDVVKFFYDQTDQTTKANRYLSNADGSMGALQSTVPIEELKNLWEAGLQLWQTDPSSRNIYTGCGIQNGTCIGSTGLMDFTTAKKTILTPYLNTSGDPESEAVIRYIRGEDTPFSPAIAGFSSAYRGRTTVIDLNKDGLISGASEQQKVWKLGDIVNSTPQIISWIPLNKFDTTYGDETYGDKGKNTFGSFVKTNSYKRRGTVVSGANDGMLHAVKLGLFEIVDNGTSLKADLCDDADNNGVCNASETSTANLGKEQWAFIPKNSLPYLKYLADPNYCHIYSVDATPFVLDVSTNIITGCSETTDYWKCPKQTRCGTDQVCEETTNTLDPAHTSWRTVLIGSMRLGGACRKTASCTNCVKTPIDDPADNTKGFGYSSYFALDVTDSNNPKLLWEFSDPALGFSTSGPAIVRIKNRTQDATKSTPDPTVPGTDGGHNNGRWFAVLGSGPTGPIDTGMNFLGTSDQNLKLFILDLKGPSTGPTGSWVLNTDYWVKDTGIINAFAGSLVGGNVDFDKDYQDDVAYFGYTQKDAATGTWTKGGVLRLVTKEDLNGPDVSKTGNTALNPANWQLSTVIDNIGPVTASVASLQFTPTGETVPTDGWLFFGTGRYFYKMDDTAGQRQLFGIKDLCFKKIMGKPPYDLATTVCGASENLALADLYNSTIDIHRTAVPPVSGTWNGWYINLESPTNTATNNVEIGPCGTTACMNTTSMAERVVTDPVATLSGSVFFITFTPSSDVCHYGGQSYLWGVKYDTGSSAAAAGLLQGKGNVQLSTGQIAEINLHTAFTVKFGRDVQTTALENAGRRSGAMEGMPPTGRGLLVVAPPQPIRQILHIRKR